MDMQLSAANARGITVDNRKRVLLLHLARPAIQDIFELCQKRGIILRNNLIVIPDAVGTRILQLAHEGHQGFTKVKQHLRQRVWWPGIDIQAERYVCECLGCGPLTSLRASLNDRSTKTNMAHHLCLLLWPISIRRVSFCRC